MQRGARGHALRRGEAEPHQHQEDRNKLNILHCFESLEQLPAMTSRLQPEGLHGVVEVGQSPNLQRLPAGSDRGLVPVQGHRIGKA